MENRTVWSNNGTLATVSETFVQTNEINDQDFNVGIFILIPGSRPSTVVFGKGGERRRHFKLRANTSMDAL